MKDVFEKIPGSFKKMMAKEVQITSKVSNDKVTTIGEDDAHRENEGKLKE